jgi:hypothetical protein
MAIKDFKNIEKINQELESTAQLIKPADLNIFKTTAKRVADFGLSKNDAQGLEAEINDFIKEVKQVMKR